MKIPYRPFRASYTFFLTQGFSCCAASPWALLSRAFSACIADPAIASVLQLQIFQSSGAGGEATPKNRTLFLIFSSLRAGVVVLIIIFGCRDIFLTIDNHTADAFPPELVDCILNQFDRRGIRSHDQNDYIT
jgi:hypothetical protein